MSDRPLKDDDIDREAQRVAEQVLHRARLASGVARVFGQIGRDLLTQATVQATAQAKVYLEAVAKDALTQLGPEGEVLAGKGLEDMKRFAKAAALAAADVASAEIARATAAKAEPKEEAPVAAAAE